MRDKEHRQAAGFEFCQQSNVFRIVVIVITRIARRLRIDGSRHVFEQPIVAVDVASFDLVRGSSRTPQKSIWESHVSISASSFRMDADRQSDCDDRLGRDAALLRWRLALKVETLYEADIAGRTAHQHLKLARFGDPSFGRWIIV